MQLQLRPTEDGRSMVLTDARSRIPGCQTSVSWSQGSATELGEASVTFLVDGETLVVMADPIQTGDGTLPEALEAFGRLSLANKRRFIEAASPPPQDPAMAALLESFETFRASFRS